MFLFFIRVHMNNENPCSPEKLRLVPRSMELGVHRVTPSCPPANLAPLISMAAMALSCCSSLCPAMSAAVVPTVSLSSQ